MDYSVLSDIVSIIVIFIAGIALYGFVVVLLMTLGVIVFFVVLSQFFKRNY